MSDLKHPEGGGSRSKKHDRVPKFTSLNDLAGVRVGGKVLFATDDWFAACENLLKPNDPQWREAEFTKYGKWMDGWETRRKRSTGHDWCVIQLGVPGIISGFDVNTCYFTGNYPPRISIQGACLEKDYPARRGNRIGTAASNKELEFINKLKSQKWTEIVPTSTLEAGYLTSCHNYFSAQEIQRFTHLRLNIFPDGGIARLWVYGRAAPNWTKIPEEKLIDLAAMQNGGVCLAFSNSHYGHAKNLIGDGRAANMGDGWETARRLDRPAVLTSDDKGVLQIPGFEWAVFRLGHPGVVNKIEIDTNHFKGNFPDSCQIEACHVKEDKENEIVQDFNGASTVMWKILLPTQKLRGHTRHYYSTDVIKNAGVISHIRISMAPDGGISRMRLWGYRTSMLSSRL